MKEQSLTPQINLSKIPGGDGIAGAMFAVGSMLIFLVGIPTLWYFFPAAIITGCGVALLIHWIRAAIPRELPGTPWLISATKR